MVPLQDDPEEPAATKSGRGRPKRVCIIEEPDYKEHDEASSPVPQPDTEDQPVSVWASSLCSSHAGLQVAAALLLSSEEEAVPRKLPPVIMNLLLLLSRTSIY